MNNMLIDYNEGAVWMDRYGKLDEFGYYVLPSNISGSVDISLESAVTDLASTKIHSDRDHAVLLTATVGYQAVTDGTGLSRVNVLFKIWRGSTMVFSANDTAESTSDQKRVTSFTHVDTGFTASRHYKYVLTAELPDIGSAATIIGPVTLTATEIEM